MLSVDWITGTIPHDKYEMLIAELTDRNGADPEFFEYGQYRYNRSVHFHALKIVLHYDDSKDRADSIHGGRCCLVCCGESLHMLGPNGSYDLVRLLINKYWLKASRVDLAFDDYNKTIDPATVYKDHCQESRDYTRFKACAFRCDLNGAGEPTSQMLTFGRRGKCGGGSYLRFYRKDLESNGAIDAYRWEVEFSKEKAQQAVFALSRCQTLDEFTVLVGSLVGGSIDFVIRADKNLDRGTRVEWWARIVEIIGVSQLRLAHSECEIEKSQEWVVRSVIGSLASLEKAWGELDFWDWLVQMVEVKRDKLNKKQLAAVDRYWTQYGLPHELPF